MGRKIVVPKQEEEYIINGFKSGMSINKLGDKYGFPKRTISRIIKNAGLKVVVNDSRTYSEEHKQEIVDMYLEGYSMIKVGKKFGHSKPVISKIVKAAGVKVNKHGVNKLDASGVNKEEILERYKNGESVLSLVREFKTDKSNIKRFLKENDIEARGNQFHFYNRGYFNTLTPDSCYHAGFIAADGSVNNKRQSMTIYINEKDVSFLEDFQECLGIEDCIKKYTVHAPIMGVLPKKPSNMVRLNLCSKEIVDGLRENFNIVQNKSLILNPPDISEENLAACFIKGNFDGDGSISINKDTRSISVSFLGTEQFLNWILDTLKNYAGIESKTVVRKKDKDENIYILSLGGAQQVYKVLKWMDGHMPNKLGFDRKSLDRYIRELGVPDENWRFKIDKDMHKEIVGMHEKGMSCDEIGIKLSCNGATIRAILKKEGCVLRPGVRYSNLTEEYKKEIVDKYKSGSTAEELAKEYRHSTVTLRKIIVGSGCKVRLGGPNNIDRIPESVFIADYKSGLSTTKIAAKYKCSRARISELLRRNGIVLRGVR